MAADLSTLLDLRFAVGHGRAGEALPPGPDLSDRARAAFAWQDEVLRQPTPTVSGRSGG
jgi:hypothetical protein